MAPPTYPELNRVMTMVRSPVFGPRVLMNAVATAPNAPKQRMVAIACLQACFRTFCVQHEIVALTGASGCKTLEQACRSVWS